MCFSYTRIYKNGQFHSPSLPSISCFSSFRITQSIKHYQDSLKVKPLRVYHIRHQPHHQDLHDSHLNQDRRLEPKHCKHNALPDKRLHTVGLLGLDHVLLRENAPTAHQDQALLRATNKGRRQGHRLLAIRIRPRGEGELCLGRADATLEDLGPPSRRMKTTSCPFFRLSIRRDKSAWRFLEGGVQ